MKRFVTVISGIMLLISLSAHAQVFSVSLPGGNKLFFQVSDTTSKQVEVIRAGALINAPIALPTGSLEIPASVSYKGVSYKVASLHEGVFKGADNLSFVSIPSTVKTIGARAFSGCSNLEGVTFPASEPEMGDAVFEGCKSLYSVSLGSDWRAVDLSLFAASDTLASLFIPAKVVKITNLKLIKTLERVDVDRNNPAFSSIDGILYSRDGKALYACPNARVGELTVPAGVERIQEAAFNGCTHLTGILLPSTVHDFSYMDFASCTSLTDLTILAEMPPITARWNGSPVFAIRKPGSSFRVFVSASSLERYQAAVCDNGGTYESMAGKHKETLQQDSLIGKKDIMKVKVSR